MLKINLVYTTIIATLLFSGSFAKRDPKEHFNQAISNIKSELSKLPFITLEDICKDQVILDFDDWYEAWIIQYMISNQNRPGSSINKDVHKNVEDHLEELTDYVGRMNKKKENLVNFPPLHLDIKITHLNKLINKILNEDLPNKFEHEDLVGDLVKKHGYYIPTLIKSVTDLPLTTELIKNIGIAYKDDHDVVDPFNKDLMGEKVYELAIPLIATLKKILKVFSTNKPGVYEQLANSPADKEFLQEFFDKFRFLLTPTEIRDIILQNMIGKLNSKGIYNGEFFTPEVFNSLTTLDTPYSSLIHRDRFITIPEEEYNLEKIHKAAHKLFFSWAFLKEFDADAKDLGLDKSFEIREKESPDVKLKRKQAKLRLMLYKVYLFARHEGQIPDDKDMTTQNIFKNLKTWIEETKNFDQPTVGELGIIELPNNDCSQLFPAAKFRRYHLPLLNLICERLDDCNLLTQDNLAKTVANYVKHGNFKELEQKKDIAGLLPLHIIQAIDKEVINNGIKAINDDIEDILDFDEELEEEEDLERTDKPEDILLPHDLKHKPKLSTKKSFTEEPDLFEEDIDKLPRMDSFSDEEKTPKKSSPLKMKVMKKKPVQMMARINPQQQKKFDDFVEVFLPEDGEINSKTKDIVHTYVQKIGETDNQKKKTIMRTLIHQTILKRFKQEEAKKTDSKQPNKALELAVIVNTDLVAGLRNSYDYSHTEGLKNFFMRILNKDMKSPFQTVSMLEQKFYNYDIIFFLYFANLDRFAKAEKNQADMTQDQFTLIKVKTSDTNKVLDDNFFRLKDEMMPTVNRIQLREKLVFRNPLLIERISAFEFFINFFDFFNYYKNIPQVSEATYGNYHPIYLNFYTFLTALRTQITSQIENPHQYVLEKLEACLAYTDEVEKFDKEIYKTICKMSHRKFAEMYYFYKIYLISEKKISKVDLSPFPGSKFDTHLRLFINFLKNYPGYAHYLEQSCLTQETASVCFVWKFYNKLLTYVHTPNLTTEDLIVMVKEVYQPENVNSKINILNTLEALHMNIMNGNIKDYEKVLGFLTLLQQNGLNVLKFTNDDSPALTQYLSRTYRKMEYSNNEVPTFQAVHSILTGVSSSDVSQDSFGIYMVHGGVVYLDYIKLFLLMASSPTEYKRIADFIIKVDAGASLVKINNLSYDKEFSEFFTNVRLSDLPLEARKEQVLQFMKKRYNDNHQVCYEIIRNEIDTHLEDSEDYDPMADYADEQETKVQETIKVETINANEVLKKSSGTKKLSESSDAGILIFENRFQIQEEVIDDGEFDYDDEVITVTKEINQLVNENDEVISELEQKPEMRFNGEPVKYAEASKLKDALNSNLLNFIEKGEVVSHTQNTYKLGNDNTMHATNDLLHTITNDDFLNMITNKKNNANKQAKKSSPQKKSVKKSSSNLDEEFLLI